MSAEKSLALVLRVIEFSESSCIVTLLTRDFGKIGALAKGARRPKGPFEAALDLLAVCRVVFLRKSSESLDLLTEAKLERRFRAGSRDLTRLYVGYYIAELLRELTDHADPHPELFDLANETLRELDGDAEVFPLLLRFELGLLRLLGHLPTLHECAGCGQEIVVAGRVTFGLLAGGVLCRACRGGQRQVVSLSAETLQILRRHAAVEPQEPLGTIDRRCRGEVRGVMNQFVTHLLGHRPKLQAYLGALTRDSA